MKNNHFAAALLLLTILFSACRAKKEITKIKLPNRNADELVELMQKSEINNQWLSLKVSADATIDGKSNSFKANVRIRKDSAVWMSISPLFGIEMVRLLITKDSVKFMNRLKSTYFMGNYDYLNDLLNTHVDYEIIESLLIGNSIAMDEIDKPIANEDKHNNQYVLSSIRKRKIRRAVEKDKDKYGSIAYSHWLNPETFKIEKLTVYDLDDDRSIHASFSDFQKIGAVLFPGKSFLMLQGEEKIEVKTEYTKVTLDNPVSLSFKIPSKYERVVIVNEQEN